MHRAGGPPRHRAPSHRSGSAQARARHASAHGEGFGRFAALTILSLIPGAGLLAAGRRRIGAVLLALVVVALAAVAAFALTGDVTTRVLRMAVRPSDLLVIAIVVGVAALVWCLTIVATALAAKPDRPSRVQAGLATLLVTALCVAVIAPSSVGVRYALIQRDLVTSLFPSGGSGTKVPGAAAPDTQKKDPWANTPRVNVLLLGSDAGSDRTGVRTDSMMVASIDTHTGDALLIGIPRSLQNVPFPTSNPLHKVWPNGFNCGSPCLMNAVWTQAVQHKDLFPGVKNPGLVTTRDVIGEVTGLRIDTYVIVDPKGFTSLVDAMGGVNVDVKQRLPIGGGLIDGTTRHRPVTGYIEPGKQRLNGYEAMWYTRSRSSTDDYDRMRRQRCMIGNLVDQVNPVTMLSKYAKLASVLKNNLQTDISQDQLSAWVDLAMRMKDGQIRSLPLTLNVIKTYDPDFNAIRAYIQAGLHPAPKTPSTSTPSSSATSKPSSTKPGATDSSTAQALSEVC